MSWATRRWRDAETGAEIVCLSPDRKAHFRNNYFRHNMLTGDGRLAVFCELGGLEKGRAIGASRLWARDLLSGQLRGPCEFNGTGDSCVGWAVAWRSHRANMLERQADGSVAIRQVDLDSGNNRLIVPKRRLESIYEATFSADERYVYTPCWTEKFHLRKTMPARQYAQMMHSQPGFQEMLRIDLETGDVETVFTATEWNMGHPNPHPAEADLFMCCQEWCGHTDFGKWGPPKEQERIRVIDLSTRQWLDIRRRCDVQSAHEHWAPRGRRIYSHLSDRRGIHLINLIDLDAGRNTWFACPWQVGDTAHVTAAPNEQFLVGDGRNFDRTTLPDDVRRRLLAAREDPEHHPLDFVNIDLACTNGGETIWKYELPAETVWDDRVHGGDREQLARDVAANPDKVVRVTPVCKFRSLVRTLQCGYRLESNPHVTPDSRWVVFQSSSEDDWFQVWAARVPESS